MMITGFDQLRHFRRELWAIKSHLRIEVVAFFSFLPFFLTMIGMSVFELEKACRVNLRLESEICDNLNNIPYKEMCPILESHDGLFMNRNASENGLNELLKTLHTKGHRVEGLSELFLVQNVCEAEKESQKLVSKMFAIRAPIGKANSLDDLECFIVSISFLFLVTATGFTLLIVLFAGSWSDKASLLPPLFHSSI